MVMMDLRSLQLQRRTRAQFTTLLQVHCDPFWTANAARPGHTRLMEEDEMCILQDHNVMAAGLPQMILTEKHWMARNPTWRPRFVGMWTYEGI